MLHCSACALTAALRILQQGEEMPLVLQVDVHPTASDTNSLESLQRCVLQTLKRMPGGDKLPKNANDIELTNPDVRPACDCAVCRMQHRHAVAVMRKST